MRHRYLNYIAVICGQHKLDGILRIHFFVQKQIAALRCNAGAEVWGTQTLSPAPSAPKPHEEARGESPSSRHVITQNFLQFLVSNFSVLHVHFAVVVYVQHLLCLALHLVIVDIHEAIVRERLHNDKETPDAKGQHLGNLLQAKAARVTHHEAIPDSPGRSVLKECVRFLAGIIHKIGWEESAELGGQRGIHSVHGILAAFGKGIEVVTSRLVLVLLLFGCAHDDPFSRQHRHDCGAQKNMTR